MNFSRRKLLGASALFAGSSILPRLVSAKDGVITIAQRSTLDSTPPPGSFDIQGEPLFGNAEFLMRPTVNGPIPWLAESVAQIEPTRWQVTLKPGLTFQNGRALDSAALVACLEYYRTPQNLGDPELRLLGRPTSFESTGPLTVDIATPEPFPRTDFGLAHYSFPIFDAAAVAEVNEDWPQLVSKGIFTGPFQWSKIEPGVVTYTAYDGYWAGKPVLTGVVLKAVPDEQAGVQAISAGEADALPYASLTTSVIAKGLPNVNFVVGQGVGFIGMAIEPDIAPFDDVNVRQALSLSIDNEAIAASIGQGLATPMKGWYPSSDPRAVDWLVFNPAAAEARLESAGWTRSGDDPRRRDGVELGATFYCYNDMGEEVSTAVADMATRVGFKATVQRMESYADIQPVQSVDGGIYTVYTESYGLNGDPVGTMRGVIDPTYTTPGYPDWIEIIEPIVSSTDAAEISAALIAGQKLNAEQAYWLPIMDTGTPYILSDVYKSVVPDPFYLFVDWKLAPTI